MSESPSQYPSHLHAHQPPLTSHDPQDPQLQQQQQPPPPDDLMLQLNVKSGPIGILPPRVLDYTPHFGPEGQTFTVTLQSNTNKILRIGFGTLVVDTKHHFGNGYVTLCCTVPNFAITKWFATKVPLYVLQMENDVVMESWPFGDFEYYDDNIQNSSSCSNSRRSNLEMLIHDHDSSSTLVSNKRPHLVPDLDLPRTTQPLSPLPPTTPTSLNGHGFAPHDDYSVLPTSSPVYDTGLYSQSLQSLSPYDPRPPVSVSSYARSGYYNSSQMIAPHMSSYSQPDLGVSSYALTTTATHASTYKSYPQPVAPSTCMPQPQPQPQPTTTTSLGTGLPLSSYNPYASLIHKADLKFAGNTDDMAINWSAEEWQSHRRLVQFWRRQDGNDIHCTFAPVAPADRQPNSIVVSCIYWAERNDCFLTSVDCIYLLESLIAVRFTVEEKNRIRRNLEGFRPMTVSKCKPESAEFFKLVMSFPNPKPRNIEKDVKVFPWRVLPYALKKIISKYTASYSSTASIQSDVFHNANFPHDSTLPMTPQQQSIIESSSIIA